jgi:hypothetical protein
MAVVWRNKTQIVGDERSKNQIDGDERIETQTLLLVLRPSSLYS